MGIYLLTFINLLGLALYIFIFARVILSWIRIGPDSSFVSIARVIYQVTEPILAPIRRLLPNTGGLDLSPMIALFLLIIIQNIARRVLG